MRGIARCESPLEVALANAFAECGAFEWRSDEDHEWEVGRWPGIWLALLAQPQYGKYRCDFGVCSCFPRDFERPPFIVVVEADGHEFHEKTREQIERGKQRDRFMTATGASVFRFSGREIYRDAGACAVEVLEYVNGIQQANMNAHWKSFVDAAAASGEYQKKKAG